MDIPVRVSINRKSPDSKNANGPFRDRKEFDSSTGGRPQGSPPLICSTPAPTRAFTFSCIGYPHWRDTCPPVHNHPTSLEKRESQGATSHYLPDSVPLEPPISTQAWFFPCMGCSCIICRAWSTSNSLSDICTSCKFTCCRSTILAPCA